MATTETTAARLAEVFQAVKQRVESYNTERTQLADSLKQIIGSAQELLAQLGEPVATSRLRRDMTVRSDALKRQGRPPGTGRKRGRPRKTAGTRGRPKGTRLSAAARKRISEAQKARWAARKGS